MDNTPLVSIIVPNFNHSEFLKKRIDSILNQSFQNFEVILLDDCSIDKSLDVLRIYEKNKKVSHFIINKKNSESPFKQWKKGIDLARGEYIWIAESDDYCELTFLEKMIAILTKKETVGIAYCQSIIIDDSGKLIGHNLDFTSDFSPNIWKNSFVMDGSEFIKNYLSVKAVIPNTSAVVFEKNLVNNSILDESLLNMSICGDWLFWLKLCGKTKIAFCSEAINSFRYHSAVTRIHDTNLKKKLRLSEEFAIRKFMLMELNIRNEKILNKKQIAWFNIHKFNEIFTKDFYIGNILNSTNMSFAIKFIKFKIANKIGHLVVRNNIVFLNLL